MDEVGSDPRTVSRRARAVAVVVPLLVVAGVAADRWQRGRELDAWLPSLDGPRRDLRATSVLPWHRALRQAREAYARRLRAWTDVLEQTAAEPEQALTRPSEVARTRDAARTALVAVAGDERRGCSGKAGARTPVSLRCDHGGA